MNIIYRVELTQDERLHLEQLTSKGSHNSRVIKRANILRLADNHTHSHEAIATLTGCGTATVFRVKRKFVEEGLESALNEGNIKRI